MSNIIENILKVIPEALKEQAELTPYQLLALLAGEMGLAQVESEWRNAKPNQDIPAFNNVNATWSISDKLRHKSSKGNYLDSYLGSFDKRSKNTLTKVNLTSSGLTVDFGSKLPRLHETGGFIKSKGRMQYWFFYQYAKTKNPFFRIVGASIVKKGGINVKRRPHFAPTIEKFNQNLDIWLNDILNKIMKKANEL